MARVEEFEATVSADALKPCLSRLAAFSARYAPRLADARQRPHAVTYLEGLLSDLPRKTAEPIATAHGQERRGLQRFVGEGRFDDQSLVEELQAHVAEEIGDPAGILIIDPTCFAKKGTESVGVARQWNGRLGKVDNCQKAVLLGYASPLGSALIDRALYLSQDWAADPVRRQKCHVPPETAFRNSWELALDLIDRASKLPSSWIVADDEYGRPAEFRAELRKRGKRYAIDIPPNARCRLIHEVPPKRHGRGHPRGRQTRRASDVARSRKSGAWVRIFVRDGAKEPQYVFATCVDVETKLDDKWGPIERLVIIKSAGTKPEYRFAITNAESRSIAIGAVVRALATRHVIEELIQRAKGEAGLAQYEMRSWVGWHHHVTFSLLASWFLETERRRLGEKNAEHDTPAGRACPILAAPEPCR
jgi:SRSO17 transposase